MKKRFLDATLSVRLRSEQLVMLEQLSQAQQRSPAEIVRAMLDRELSKKQHNGGAKVSEAERAAVVVQ